MATVTEGQSPDRISSDHEKQRIAWLSVISNTLLVLMKIIVGTAIGSVSIISEAIHSGIDLVAAVIAFFAVRKSSEPPDSLHQFGHGKIEDLSGFIEALLIFVAAAMIIREAVLHLMSGGETLVVEGIGAGMLVMLVSGIVNYYVSSRLMVVAERTESIALASDAWHLRTDVYTSLGVFAGLILIKLTGILILDSVVAIAVACFILKAAYDLTRRSLSDLVDHRLPDEEEEQIRGIIAGHCTQYADFHALRTRRSGPDRFIELHLCVSKNLTVEEGHALADHLEMDLRNALPRSNVTIHVEPCDGECKNCDSLCNDRAADYRSQDPEEL